MTTKHHFFYLTLFTLLLLFFGAEASAQQITFADTLHSKTISVKDSTIKSASADMVFNKAEIEASVDAIAWRHHLETKLLPYLERAANKRMKPGNYTVDVRFLVEKNGSITDVVALNDPGYGLAEAAVKVIKTGPTWKPGEQDGRKVRSYHTQPITFSIQTQ